MCVATMSQKTKIAYLRKYPEKRRKKNSGSKGLSKLRDNEAYCNFSISELTSKLIKFHEILVFIIKLQQFKNI